MFKACWNIIIRDLRLAFRHPGDVINPLFFFIIVITLFPLGGSPEQKVLMSIGGSVIWVAALLSSLLSLDILFRSDYDDGTLETLLLSEYPLSLLVLAKIIAHWLITGLPLLCLSPLLAGFFYFNDQAMRTLVITLLLGMPILSLLGAVGMALTVSLKRGGMLLSLLILPFYIPVLIFSAQAINNSMLGLDVTGSFYFLAALLVFLLTLSPFVTALALRISLE